MENFGDFFLAENSLEAMLRVILTDEISECKNIKKIISFEGRDLNQTENNASFPSLISIEIF